MKKIVKIILILSTIILILLLLLKGCWHVITTVPLVKDNYTETVETGGSFESKYLSMGKYEIDYFEYKYDDNKDISKIQIYYPKKLETSDKKYPVVLFVNGTGVGTSRYKPVFKHLASWGFIAVGNEDPSTWEGIKTDLTLDFILNANDDKDSIFYQKVDVLNIGVTGHSQGGVGVYNVINNTKNKKKYKCAVSLSPTEEETANVIKIPYDPAQTSIPILMLCGTNNDVITPENMKKSFDKVTSSKVMAVRKNATHGDMLFSADGYVTAWLMYYLQNDQEGLKAIENELPNNSLYQDVYINLNN